MLSYLVSNIIPRTMEEKFPLVSVVVPAFNEENYISECLSSLFKQDLPRTDYEVIIVNNASTDKTEEIAKFFGAKVITEPKKGVVFALRRGIKETCGEIIVFTDADCRLPANCLSTILYTFNNEPEIKAVRLSLTLYDAGGLFLSVYNIIENRINFLCGGGMAIKKSALVKVGGLDPGVNLAWDFFLTKKIRAVGKIKKISNLVVETSARRFYTGKLSQVAYIINMITLTLFNKAIFFSFSDTRKKFTSVTSNVRNHVKNYTRS